MVTFNFSISPEHRSERPLCPSGYLDSESGTRFGGKAAGVTLDPPGRPSLIIGDRRHVQVHVNKALV